MRGVLRQSAKVAVATSWICGGLVSGIGGLVAPGEDDPGILVIGGWLCFGAGLWLLVKIWREPFGGGYGRHSSHAPTPVLADFRLWAAGVGNILLGGGSIVAAVIGRDLAMLGTAIVFLTGGLVMVALTRPR